MTSQAEPGARSGRGALRLALLVALFVGLYGSFYPRTFSILDEQAYLSFGLLLSRGEVYADDLTVPPARTLEVDGRLVPRTPLGTSLAIAPFMSWSWRAAFVGILIAHLAGVLACAGALRKLSLPVEYAALYLLHPVATLYARTVMSDVPTTTCMMIGVWGMLGPRSRPFLAGLALGAVPHFRFAQLIVLPGLVLASLLCELRAPSHGASLLGRVRSSACLAAGMAPGVLSWAWVSHVLYGSLLELPMTWPLSAAHLIYQLPYYLVTQNLIYPGALLIAVCTPSPLRLHLLLVALLMLLLYGSFPFVYRGYGPAALLIGERFFLPLMPLWILPYATTLERIRARMSARRARLAAGGVILGLLVGAAALTVLHDRELRQQAALQDMLYDHTTERDLIVMNPNARELLFEGLGRRRILTSTHLFPDEPDYDAGAAARITLGRTYLFVLERTDREDAQSARVRRVRDYASSRYALVPVAQLESWPHRAELYRLTAQPTGDRPTEAQDPAPEDPLARTPGGN